MKKIPDSTVKIVAGVLEPWLFRTLPKRVPKSQMEQLRRFRKKALERARESIQAYIKATKPKRK